MSSPRLAGLVALLSICVACQSAFAASGSATPRGARGDLFPPATRPIEVWVAEPATNSLAYLVDELADATGVVFTASEVVRNMLRQTSTGLGTDLTIAPAEGWCWVEGLLLHNGFRLTVSTPRPPYVIGIVPKQPIGGRPAITFPLHVPEADLAVLEEHPALIVMTVLDLPHTDVRQLGNSLRALTNDPSGSQNLVPVGNSSSIIVSGTGQMVLDLVRMLRIVDDQAREALERVPAPDEASGAVTSPGTAPPPGRSR